MTNKVLMIILAILILTGVGMIAFFLFGPKASSIPAFNKTQTGGLTGSEPKAVTAVISYAASQFKISEDKVKMVSAEKKDWPDTCFGFPIKSEDKKCEKVVTPGFEVKVIVDGHNLTYRTNAEGNDIMVAKGN